METLSLYDLNSLVSEAIGIELPDEYWVEAEVAEARESKGHCYIELVQKDAFSNTPIARASAKCWQSKWSQLAPRFQRITGQQLHAGMKVMLRVRANFHTAFGFSWIVSDINPEYTMGDMARRRREITAQLKAEGVFELQKEMSVPMFAQRIAVISSAGAAGYEDFCKQLNDNTDGFKFTVSLFAAVMQGEQVEQSVIAALNQIYTEIDRFDTVVIIRGGGSTSDLSGFDTLPLAENVANFPLPVIVGIGHERDESVLDLIACVSVKTPTAAAAYLIDNLKSTRDRLMWASDAIAKTVAQRMEIENLRMQRLATALPMAVSLIKTRGMARLDSLYESLKTSLSTTITAQNHRLLLLHQRAIAQDPQRLLARGYSLTMLNGRTLTSPTELRDGDIIETRLAKGKVRSIVKKDKTQE